MPSPRMTIQNRAPLAFWGALLVGLEVSTPSADNEVSGISAAVRDRLTVSSGSLEKKAEDNFCGYLPCRRKGLAFKQR